MGNFLRELQMVYEDYRGDITRPPIMVNGQKAPVVSHISYRQGELPGAYPGYPSRPITTTPFQPGEDEDESMISKSAVINKISTLLVDAEEQGMTYATSSLVDLLKFVREN